MQPRDGYRYFSRCPRVRRRGPSDAIWVPLLRRLPRPGPAPGTAAHWPIALDTGGYEHARTGRHYKATSRQQGALRGSRHECHQPAAKTVLLGGDQVAELTRTAPRRDRRSWLRRL